MVLTPYPSEGDTDEMSVATLQAIETLSQYWRTTIGVEPITGTNCLGQTAAYIHLDAARTVQSVQEADITVTVAELEQSSGPGTQVRRIARNRAWDNRSR